MKFVKSNNQNVILEFSTDELIAISSCIAAVNEYFEEIDEAILNLSKSDLLNLKENYFNAISKSLVDDNE